MWKNKHIIVALLVAPVLALIAYFGVDAAVSEKPHEARDGATYPLRVMSNCRYESGECELTNGDVKLRLTQDSEGAWLLFSEVALRGVLLGVEGQGEPQPMRALDSDGFAWSMDGSAWGTSVPKALRLVVAARSSQYFAEVPTTFVNPPQ